MKILMVLTSHDKLGNTGRKTGFWLEEFVAPYYTFLDAGATVTVASPKGGQPPLDPGQRHARGPNGTDAAVQARPRRPGGAGKHGAALRREGHGLRRGLLPRRPRPDVGPRRGPAIDRPHRGLLRRRQASRRRLPCARRVPSGHVPGPTDREGQTSDGLHQRRGRSGPPHQGGAVPGGGRAEAPRRALRKGQRTGCRLSSPTAGSSPDRTRLRPNPEPRRC